MLHKKVHINKTTLIYIMLYLSAIISCKGYRFYLPQRYQYIHMQIFSLFSIISFFYFLLLFKQIKKINPYINMYLLMSGIAFIFPQLLYTYYKYNQSLSDFYNASQHFFFLLWIVPLFYLLYRDNTMRILETITNITVVGYLSLIMNAFLENHFGLMLLNISAETIAWKNGYLRILDCAVFTPVAIAYLFSNSLSYSKKRCLIKLCIVLFGQMYVEKTRMATFALVFMILSMLLFSKKNKLSKIFTWIFLVIGGCMSIIGGIVDQILLKFSVQNNGNSTLYRINEIEFYMKQFINNKLLGIGIISPEKIMQNFGLMYWQNHNYEDIGIIGLLGLSGILGIVIIYIIPCIRMLYIIKCIKKTSDLTYEFLMLVGMFAYIVATSATLLITNYQRMPCFILCIAMFESTYAIYKQKQK